MKKLVYIAIILVLVIGCSHKEQPRQEEYVAPDSVWDYTYLDSMDQDLRSRSYNLYGDSDALDKLMKEGLPDSMKLNNP